MKIRLSIALLFLSINSFAHAIWIETKANGKKGQSQEVNIYFGEYADNERDSVATWFSNLRDVKLLLVLPDGTKQPLNLEAAVNHYTSSFTPTKDGVYALSIVHTVADVYGNAKIEYYASASVSVNSDDLSPLKGATLLAIQPKRIDARVHQPVSLAVFNNAVFLPKAKVVIASPDGWTKTIYADDTGTITFTPVTTGRYMIEAIRSDKTPGTHGGKPYNAVTHLVTYCIDVR